MKQLIADLGSKATNSALGLVKGGNDINILDNGELQLDTAYDNVDVNTSANIANITKGGKFKTILGNIVAALTGLNSSVAKLNSDLNTISINQIIVTVKDYEMATKADSNVLGGYSYSCSLVSMGEVPTGTILVVPIACGQKDNWNNNGLISVHQNDFVRISANKATTYSVRIAFIRRGKV